MILSTGYPKIWMCVIVSIILLSLTSTTTFSIIFHSEDGNKECEECSIVSCIAINNTFTIEYKWVKYPFYVKNYTYDNGDYLANCPEQIMCIIDTKDSETFCARATVEPKGSVCLSSNGCITYDRFILWRIFSILFLISSILILIMFIDYRSIEQKYSQLCGLSTTDKGATPGQGVKYQSV